MYPHNEIDFTSLTLDQSPPSLSTPQNTSHVSHMTNLSHIHASRLQSHPNRITPHGDAKIKSISSKLVGYPGWSYFVKLYHATQILCGICIVHVVRLLFLVYGDFTSHDSWVHRVPLPMQSVIPSIPTRSLLSLQSVFPTITILLCFYLYLVVPHMEKYVAQQDRKNISRDIPPPPPVLHITFELLMLILTHLFDFASIPFLEYPFMLYHYVVLTNVSSLSSSSSSLSPSSSSLSSSSLSSSLMDHAASTAASTAATAGLHTIPQYSMTTWDALQPILLYSFAMLLVIIAITSQLCIVIIMLLDIRKVYQCQIWWNSYIHNFQTKQRVFVIGSYNQVNQYNRFAVLADDRYDYSDEHAGNGGKALTDEEKHHRKMLKYKRQKQYIQMLKRRYAKQLQIQREYDLKQLQHGTAAMEHQSIQEPAVTSTASPTSIPTAAPTATPTAIPTATPTATETTPSSHIDPSPHPHHQMTAPPQSLHHLSVEPNTTALPSPFPHKKVGFIDDIDSIDTSQPAKLIDHHVDHGTANAHHGGDHDEDTHERGSVGDGDGDGDSDDDDDDDDNLDDTNTSLLGHTSSNIQRVPCVVLPPYIIPPGLMHPWIRPFATKMYSIIVKGVHQLISDGATTPHNRRFTSNDVYPT